MPDIRKPFFVMPLATTITAGSTTSGFPASNLLRWRDIGLVWKSTGSNQWLRGDFGTAQAVDFCALLASNAQAGTTIRLRLGMTQAEVDGTAPFDSGVQPFGGLSATDSQTLSLNFVGNTYWIEEPVAVRHGHLELSSPVSARWWRIDIGGHSGNFEATFLNIGKKLEPSEFHNYEYEYGLEDLGGNEINYRGVVDYQPGIKLRTIEFTLSWQTEAEYETGFRPMNERLGSSEPLYLCFDPAPSAYRAARTYFGWLRKPAFARGIRKPRTFVQEYALRSLI